MATSLVNPYLEVGTLHNQGTDYIAAQLKAPNVPSVDQIVSLVLD